MITIKEKIECVVKGTFVAGIIMVLISGLSTISTGGEDEDQKICANNLKALGRAFLMYMQDHEGYLPSRGPHTQYDETGPKNVYIDDPELWQLQIMKYLDIKKGDYSVFHCPSYNKDTGGLKPESEIMTYAILRATQNGEPSGRTKGKHISEIENAERHFLLVESVGGGNVRTSLNFEIYYWNPYPEQGGVLKSIDFRHNGGANFLFLDGHVEWLKPADVQFGGSYKKEGAISGKEDK